MAGGLLRQPWVTGCWTPFSRPQVQGVSRWVRLGRGGLTLDAEAELLLLVGDVAGDSPDERHGQGAGDAGDRPRLRHPVCGAQRERVLSGGGTRGTPPVPPPSPGQPCGRGATHLHRSRCRCCPRHLQEMGARQRPRAPPRPRRHAGQPGGQRARRGTPGLGASDGSQGTASPLPHASARLPGPLGIAPRRGLKLLLCPTARGQGEPLRGGGVSACTGVSLPSPHAAPRATSG